MLPKVSSTIYTTKLPTTEQEIKFRAWTMKEEKILLLAKESGEVKEFIDAMVQIVNNCVVSKVDVLKMPILDIEYLYLKIRVKSVGNNIPITIIDPDDNEEYILNLDIDNVDVLLDDRHNKKIMIDSNLGVIMKYPSIPIAIKMAENLQKENMSDSDAYDIVKNCIESIFDDKSVYPTSKCSDAELTEFFESLSPSHFQLLYDFFETMPKLSYVVEYKTRGGVPKKYLIDNIKDFF